MTKIRAMNTELKKSKKWVWKIIFQVDEQMENVRKHWGNKLVTTGKKNYLVSESSYQSKKKLTENLLAIEMRKTQTFINKPGYLDLLILGLLIFISILLIYY